LKIRRPLRGASVRLHELPTETGRDWTQHILRVAEVDGRGVRNGSRSRLKRRIKQRAARSGKRGGPGRVAPFRRPILLWMAPSSIPVPRAQVGPPRLRRALWRSLDIGAGSSRGPGIDDGRCGPERQSPCSDSLPGPFQPGGPTSMDEFCVDTEAAATASATLPTWVISTLWGLACSATGMVIVSTPSW